MSFYLRLRIIHYYWCFFFLMIRRPPRSTRTDTLFPYTTLFRSVSNSTRITRVCGPRIATTFTMPRSEEHTSELQSLMRISYAVFCLKKKKDVNTADRVHDLRLIQQSKHRDTPKRIISHDSSSNHTLDTDI